MTGEFARSIALGRIAAQLLVGVNVASHSMSARDASCSEALTTLRARITPPPLDEAGDCVVDITNERARKWTKIRGASHRASIYPSHIRESSGK